MRSASVDSDSSLSDILIRRLELRDELSREERDVISHMLTTSRPIAAGEDIVRDGSRPRQSTLIVSGLAARYTALQDGSRQITALHMAGDFVDLHSYLLKRMDHAVVALGPCRIATVPHEILTTISERHPHLARLFWLLTLIDGSMHREWLVTMGRLPALARTAHLICEIYVRLDAVGLARDRRFAFPVTQADASDMLGLSGVHMNRVIQELRGAGLIFWQNQEIAVLDWDGLQALGEFDPAYLHHEREPR